MLRVLSGERGTNPPAVFHTWGDYKGHTGCHPRRGAPPAPGAAEGTFVIANGTPLVLGTTAANLDAYMEKARS
ncbi:MAG: hypothetical protein WCR06_08470 [bacterium]